MEGPSKYTNFESTYDPIGKLVKSEAPTVEQTQLDTRNKLMGELRSKQNEIQAFLEAGGSRKGAKSICAELKKNDVDIDKVLKNISVEDKSNLRVLLKEYKEKYTEWNAESSAELEFKPENVPAEVNAWVNGETSCEDISASDLEVMFKEDNEDLKQERAQILYDTIQTIEDDWNRPTNIDSKANNGDRRIELKPLIRESFLRRQCEHPDVSIAEKPFFSVKTGYDAAGYFEDLYPEYEKKIPAKLEAQYADEPEIFDKSDLYLGAAMRVLGQLDINYDKVVFVIEQYKKVSEKTFEEVVYDLQEWLEHYVKNTHPDDRWMLEKFRKSMYQSGFKLPDKWFVEDAEVVDTEALEKEQKINKQIDTWYTYGDSDSKVTEKFREDIPNIQDVYRNPNFLKYLQLSSENNILTYEGETSIDRSEELSALQAARQDLNIDKIQALTLTANPVRETFPGLQMWALHTVLRNIYRDVPESDRDVYFEKAYAKFEPWLETEQIDLVKNKMQKEIEQEQS